MVSIVQQINALSSLLIISPQEFRHLLLAEDQPVKAGEKISLINYSIPLYNGLVVANLQLKLTDANGKEVDLKDCVCQWFANKEAVTSSIQCNAHGEVFQVFGDGDNISLGLAVSPNLKGQHHLFVRASTFLVPSSKTQLLANNATILSNQNLKPVVEEVVIG